MALVQRLVTRLAVRRAQVNVLVVESTGVPWRTPSQTTKTQLQARTSPLPLQAKTLKCQKKIRENIDYSS